MGQETVAVYQILSYHHVCRNGDLEYMVALFTKMHMLVYSMRVREVQIQSLTELSWKSGSGE